MKDRQKFPKCAVGKSWVHYLSVARMLHSYKLIGKMVNWFQLAMQPSAQTSPLPVVSLMAARDSGGLGQLYPAVLRIYCNACTTLIRFNKMIVGLKP